MSININNYLRNLPIENLWLNTIPLAILILGLAEFLLFHVTLDWGRKLCNFFSSGYFSKNSSKSQISLSKICKKLDGEKNQDLGFSNKKTILGKNLQNDESLCREETEMVLQRLGIFCYPEGGRVQERLNSEDLVHLFEENNPSFDELKEAFDVFDENRDGFIDSEELQRVLVALGLKEGVELENCKRMIRLFDENGDEKIDFDEFVKFMENIDC